MRKTFYDKACYWTVILLLWLLFPVAALTQDAATGFKIGTKYNKNSYTYKQIPDPLVIKTTPSTRGITLQTNYQWEQTTDPNQAFISISGATNKEVSFSKPLTNPTYFRLKLTRIIWLGGSNTIPTTTYSAVYFLNITSPAAEPYHYTREHNILVPNMLSSNWIGIDTLPIGKKMVTTTYTDGWGRAEQEIFKQVATPAPNSSVWGDIVQYAQYDANGRQNKEYLPFSTTAEIGLYKTQPLEEQKKYYTNNFQQDYAYSSITYQKNLFSEVANIKAPGNAWANSGGQAFQYSFNEVSDSVCRVRMDQLEDLKLLSRPYPSLLINVVYPSYEPYYAPNSLLKNIYIDENNQQVIDFIDGLGNLILKRVQTDQGWIETRNVYNEFNQLVAQIQPAGVKWLKANNWNFFWAQAIGVLLEQCFFYRYDEKGRIIQKKAPNANLLTIIYDERDRPVFMQDGNQALQATPEWTINTYDELDRLTTVSLYHTKIAADSLRKLPALSTPTDSPIPSTQWSNATITTPLKYYYYDNYTFSGVQAFNTQFENIQAYTTSDTILPIAASMRTLSLPTGSSIRVLNSTTFLSTTQYYDEKGRSIQTLSNNIKNGTDISTVQYHWDGRVMSTSTLHTAAGTGYTRYGIITKYIFDKIGRISQLQKKYGTNAFATVAAYAYDDMGRLKNKTLDPNFKTTGKKGLETLNYSYNIHSNLTGINADYALKTDGKYDKWKNYFGMHLGFENADNIFAKANLDGMVTGVVWNTQGDDAQRKYNFSYDAAGRFTQANFSERQQPNEAWSNGKVDFSVSGDAQPNIPYDPNGNIQGMTQKGVLIGKGVVEIDKLTYTYGANSNRLLSVADNNGLEALNGRWGDFRNGVNPAATPDYTYDANGNLTKDANKNITAISYNYLDKPQQITIEGKGKLEMVYDADGNLLQKIYIAMASTPATVTSYTLPFVYESLSMLSPTRTPATPVTNLSIDSLSYIFFEEGRIRVMQPVQTNNGYDNLTIQGNLSLPNRQMGTWDYYLRDYQENVRMILTEEIHKGSNLCTMENARKTAEQPYFGVNTTANPVITTRYAIRQIVGGWPGNNSQYASRLSKNTFPIGPNSLLKVMAGDTLSATVQYYYKGMPNNNPNQNNLLKDVLNSLLLALTSSTNPAIVGKINAPGLQEQLTNFTPFADKIDPPESGNLKLPRAYLAILFFDERMQFLPESSQLLRVTTTNNSRLTLLNQQAPKNGYAYIYLCNESDLPVYFDNLAIAFNRGNLIEEDHYYPYGQIMAGISSRKIPSPYEWDIKNNYLYNDKPFFDEAGLNWYNYGFRYYDPQIGRFPQLDPLTGDYPMLTPYQYASCEPIANIDIDGLEGAQVLEAFVTAARHSAKVLKSVDWLAMGSGLLKVTTGSLEMFSGGVLIVGSGGVGAFLGGGALVLHGADNVGAGLREIFSGQEAKTFTERGVSYGLQKTGVSQGIADQIGSTINEVISGGFGLKSVSILKFGGTALKLKPPTSAVKTAFSGKGTARSAFKVGKGGATALEQTAVHGNSLKSLKPTWGYKLFSNDGTFLKNGITNKLIPERRYTKAFMSDKYMEAIPFPNRLEAYQWEFGQNQILRGSLNLNMH